VIRPNAVELRAEAVPGRSLAATVRKAVYLGSHWEYTLDTEGGELFVTQPIDGIHAAGTTVHVVLTPERLRLVARPPSPTAG
jgi:iron(III) transport system ATP-binding protein